MTTASTEKPAVAFIGLGKVFAHLAKNQAIHDAEAAAAAGRKVFD